MTASTEAGGKPGRGSDEERTSAHTSIGRFVGSEPVRLHEPGGLRLACRSCASWEAKLLTHELPAIVD